MDAIAGFTKALDYVVDDRRGQIKALENVRRMEDGEEELVIYEVL